MNAYCLERGLQGDDCVGETKGGPGRPALDQTKDSLFGTQVDYQIYEASFTSVFLQAKLTWRLVFWFSVCSPLSPHP